MDDGPPAGPVPANDEAGNAANPPADDRGGPSETSAAGPGETRAEGLAPIALDLTGISRPLAPGLEGTAASGSLGLRIVPTPSVEVKPVETTPAEETGKDANRTLPEVIESVAPVYPLSARLAGLQGAVYLEVDVGPDGIPQEAGVSRSSGHAELDAAAVDAVMRWRFSPAREDGQPVSAKATVVIEFRLADS